MRDPVIADDGYTYERESIERWILEKRTSGVAIVPSPSTNLPLATLRLIPNHALRLSIDRLG